MVSARAYRDPLSFDQASGILQEAVESAFDGCHVRRVAKAFEDLGEGFTRLIGDKSCERFRILHLRHQTGIG